MEPCPKNTEVHPKQTKGNHGRKHKLSKREDRSIIKALHYTPKQDCNFTSKRIRLYSCVSSVHDRTLRRVLNKYGSHTQLAKRKGLLREKDLKLPTNFRKDIKKYYDDELESSGICFCFVVKLFIHKTNPMDQTKTPNFLVQIKTKGIIKGFTSKENKAGHGGKAASFFVAISLRKRIYY